MPCLHGWNFPAQKGWKFIAQKPNGSCWKGSEMWIWGSSSLWERDFGLLRSLYLILCVQCRQKRKALIRLSRTVSMAQKGKRCERLHFRKHDVCFLFVRFKCFLLLTFCLSRIDRMWESPSNYDSIGKVFHFRWLFCVSRRIDWIIAEDKSGSFIAVAHLQSGFTAMILSVPCYVVW